MAKVVRPNKAQQNVFAQEVPTSVLRCFRCVRIFQVRSCEGVVCVVYFVISCVYMCVLLFAAPWSRLRPMGSRRDPHTTWINGPFSH
ncbi:hypothetical protein Sjap_021205 [Stephania japonica]|uniref:Uncharacterized protein n=1 Tax=Stephania japonica TaxID=461633 RepID=A0AAP0I0X1_9MAGN